MKSIDTIAEDLFNKIRGRFPSVTIGNAEGKLTNNPKEARFFDFDFKDSSKNLGKVSISVNENSVVVMYNNTFVENEDDSTKENWYNFLKELRIFSKKRLLNFDTRDITKSNLTKRDYKFLATERPGEIDMNESKLYGTSKTSYQDVDSARIAIRHKRPVNPELAAGRTQHIDSIYVESAEGERFKYPYKHLNGARAMARHVAEGGKPYDDFGQHITGLSEELAKLRKFKNYMGRSAVMAESLAGYVDVVKERIDTVKNTVSKLQKSSFYKEAVDSFETPVFEEVPDEVKENWIDELTIKQFNEELADVFPYIYKLVSEATRAKEIGPEDLLSERNDFAHEVADKLHQKGIRYDYEDEREIILKMADLVKQLGHERVMSDKGFVADVLDDLANMDHDDDHDGQPSSYDEDQDLYGGDEDFGGYDEAVESSIEELMGQFAEGDKMARVPLDGPVTTYTVQKGDTLYSLAKKIGTSVDMLKKLNRMDSDNIQVGQKINVPESMTEEYGPEDDEFHKGIHVALGGNPDKWIPHRDRPVNGDHIELKVPERYRKAQDVIMKMFAKITDIDMNKLDVDYTTGQRTVMIDGETPHPSILSALNGTLDKLDTGEISGLYKEENKFSNNEIETDDKKIPVTEFILSYFDRETGVFPKGETAVLTKIEKDYGEEYIEPAKQFIEAINNKVAEVMGYRDNELEEEPISELGAGGPISMAIANTEVGDKIVKALDDRSTKGLNKINLMKLAQEKLGPLWYDLIGLSDEEKAKAQADMERIFGNPNENESSEINRIRGLAGLK